MYGAVKVDEEKCNGCKVCVFACPNPNVLTLLKTKKITVNQDRCKACGLCASVCLKEALIIN